MFANAKKILITTETCEIVVIHKPASEGTIWTCPLCGNSRGDPAEGIGKRHSSRDESFRPTSTEGYEDPSEVLTAFINDFLEEEK